MFFESLINKIPEPERIILFSTIPAILSFLYVKFYRLTRKISTADEMSSKISLSRLIPLFFLNFLILVIDPPRDGAPVHAASAVLLCLIADIDLLIQKIPTELLFTTVILLLFSSVTPENWKLRTFFILMGLFWIPVKRKTRMGIYDVVLIGFLSSTFSQVESVLLFYSLILILWGLTGLIFIKIFHKERQIKIPLSPIIIISFQLIKLIY